MGRKAGARNGLKGEAYCQYLEQQANNRGPEQNLLDPDLIAGSVSARGSGRGRKRSIKETAKNRERRGYPDKLVSTVRASLEVRLEIAWV